LLRIGGKITDYCAVLSADDRDWWKYFECLSSGAQLIIVIPGATASLHLELTTISKNRALRDKTVLYQPSTHVVKGWHTPPRLPYDPERPPHIRYDWLSPEAEKQLASTRPAVWDEIAAALLSFGFTIPSFNPDGQIVLVNGKGGVVSLNNKYEGSDQLRKFVESFPPGQPVNQALRALLGITKTSSIIGSITGWWGRP
jgi:hypothetical protein